MDKVLRNGLSKFCGRQPLKNLKGYGSVVNLKGYLKGYGSVINFEHVNTGWAVL